MIKGIKRTSVYNEFCKFRVFKNQNKIDSRGRKKAYEFKKFVLLWDGKIKEYATIKCKFGARLRKGVITNGYKWVMRVDDFYIRINQLKPMKYLS